MDWDEGRTGFVEVELVAHEGGRARGNYAQTLDLTDVATGWTELATVPGKAQVWGFEAIQQLTFTRSRPHRKNDHCFVEQKNYSVVRHHVGCARWDTAESPSPSTAPYDDGSHLRHLFS